MNEVLVKFIKCNQIYYLKLDVSTSIRGLHQKKLVLSTSGSWYDGKTPCRESGRMRGSVGSCSHHGSWPVVLRFRYVMCMASLIHLVKRSGSLSITVAWDQLMTWFFWAAWSVRASSRNVNNRKNWVTASSDEGLWQRSKRQVLDNKFGCVWWI